MLDEFSRKKKTITESQSSSQKANSPLHSTDSAISPPHIEAPKLGVSRLAQLEKAKREGADYQKQREREEKKEGKGETEQDRRKISQSRADEKRPETKSQTQSQTSDSIPPEKQFSQTFIDSFFEEREPIPPLTEEEEKEVYRIVNEYFLEHPPEGADYLVSGAAFICKYCQETNGSCEPVKIEHADHGVYADHRRFALLGSKDQIDSNHPCGKCKYLKRIIPEPREAEVKSMRVPCTNAPHWENTPPVYFRDGSSALTMNSYTVCSCNPEAIIRPISSGQEYMRKVLRDDRSGNPIIIVPGIMGSRLYKDTSENSKRKRQRYDASTRIWDPSPSSIFKVDDYLAPESTLSILVRPCENQNYAKPCYGEGSVKLDGREYGAQELAKALVDGLCECEKLGHRRVYMFSYDWRQSNFISATKLRRFIEKLCKEEGFEKVDLIGHSMGGLLISSLYAGHIVVDGIADPLFTRKDLSIRSKIDKIITLGTPYEGAPKLIDAVINDHMFSSDVELDIKANLSDFFLAAFGKLSKRIKSSFRGVAELIPTKKYVDTGHVHVNMLSSTSSRKAVFDYSTDYTDYIACCKKIFSEEIIEKAILFQNAIRENERNILFGYPKAFFIIGTGYPTLHEIYLDNGREKLQYTCYDKDIRSLYIESEEKCGDGTVPYFSSTMGGILPSMAKERFCSYPVRHVELCSCSNFHYIRKDRVSILDNIVNILLYGSMLAHD